MISFIMQDSLALPIISGTTLFLALFSTVFAGVFLKIIEKLMNKKKEEVDEAVQIRKELREQVGALKIEIDSLRKEVIEWREKYWEQVKLTAQQNTVIAELRSEIADLRRALTDRRLMRDSDDVAIFYATPGTGATIYVNKAWEALTGLMMTDALEFGWLKIIHADDHAEVYSGWKRAIDRGESYVARYRYVNEKTQLETPVVCTATPLHDADGSIKKYVGVVLPLEYLDLTTESE